MWYRERGEESKGRHGEREAPGGGTIYLNYVQSVSS